MPSRSGHRRSLASSVNAQIDSESDCPSVSIPVSKKPPLSLLAGHVTSKLEECDFRGAIRLASSDDTFAENDESVFIALCERHPCPPSNCIIPPCESVPSPSVTVSESVVLEAVSSFPCGSAGGALITFV